MMKIIPSRPASQSSLAGTFDRIEEVLSRGPATVNTLYVECTPNTALDGCSISLFRNFVDTLVGEGRVARSTVCGYPAYVLAGKAVRS